MEEKRIVVAAADPLATNRDLLEEECDVIRESLGTEGTDQNVTSLHTLSGEEFLHAIKERMQLS
jgi:hypothetical protein